MPSEETNLYIGMAAGAGLLIVGGLTLALVVELLPFVVMGGGVYLFVKLLKEGDYLGK